MLQLAQHMAAHKHPDQQRTCTRCNDQPGQFTARCCRELRRRSRASADPEAKAPRFAVTIRAGVLPVHRVQPVAQTRVQRDHQRFAVRVGAIQCGIATINLIAARVGYANSVAFRLQFLREDHHNPLRRSSHRSVSRRIRRDIIGVR